MRLKQFFISCIMLFLAFGVFAQDRQAIDSLKTAVFGTKADTAKIHLLSKLAKEYNQFSEDTSILYLKQALGLARELDNPKYKTIILSKLGKHP